MVGVIRKLSYSRTLPKVKLAVYWLLLGEDESTAPEFSFLVVSVLSFAKMDGLFVYIVISVGH